MSSKAEVTDVQDQNYFYLLALLMSMPFHHLISAREIYSSLSAKAKQSNKSINIPSIYESPNERLKLFQSSVVSAGRSSSQLKKQKTQPQSKKQSIILNRFIQLGLTNTAPSGEKFEFDWQVIFNDELQGCAEIYRAEMLIFKRMLYEQEENLKSPLKLTNENFSKYLDYELFDSLTGNETEKLLINSLSAKHRISVTTLDRRSNESISNNEEFKRTTNKKRKSEAVFNSEENLSILIGRLHGWESYLINELMIYELKTGAYWSKWRQAAKLAKFDFGLLEKMNDARLIRFYELTKLLRLASYNETEQSLPAELEIDYESFILLMPLPKYLTDNEIKNQIQNLILPLKKIDYINSFSFRETSKNVDPVLILRFNRK